jgi:hypothetical protein
VFLLTIRITALIDEVGMDIKILLSIYKIGLQHHWTNIIISALFHNQTKKSQNLKLLSPCGVIDFSKIFGKEIAIIKHRRILILFCLLNFTKKLILNSIKTYQ